MSSFSGKIKEYPQISVDRFDGRNLASTAYFLSHAHSDHMIGLSSPQFLDHLESNSGVYLYCSPITARFLQASIRHRPLSPFICPLQPEESVKITVPNVAEEASHHLWVTLIPAAHCPGSVMFLFEGRGGSVLYTGDFRINAGDAARLNPLHAADGTVKLIDSLHIDTTFCHRDVMHFPGREESAQAIGDLVEDWLARGNNFLIHLICPAKYGYEYIYRSLNERFGMKIHVSRWKYRMYDTVPEIQDLLTLDATVTWIHACDWRMNNGEDIESSTNKQLPCRCVPFGVDSAPNIRLIKPSALFYAMYQSAKEIKQINHDGTFCRVLLSMHASCSEVLDLVSYLRPRKVFPNVIPFNSTKEQVLKLLHEALNRSGDHYSIEYGGSQRSSLGSFKRQLHSGDSGCNGSSISSSSMLDAGLLDVYLSSPNKRRRHSDSNMTLVLPTPRGNMKGSLSLEGESRQHDHNVDAQPSTSTASGAPTLSVTTLADSSEVGFQELEWKDPYTPSPSKSISFFQSSDTCQESNISVTLSNSAKRSLCEKVDSLESISPSESSVKEFFHDGKLGTKKTIQSSPRFNMDFYEGDKVIPRNILKTEGSQDSVELSSVFSEEGDRDSVIDAFECSRPTSSTEIHRESSIKQSRKMWYKHKYFSTPVHDEVERENKHEIKPTIGPRSSSLPLPEVHRERLIFSDSFNSTDGESDHNLPLITVSSPSDQASESQISDDTNVTMVLSSGEPSESDLALIDDIPHDLMSNTDDNFITPNNNNGTSSCSTSSLRPSVICSPSKPEAPNVEIIEINNVDGGDLSNTELGGTIRSNIKSRMVKWYEPGDWINCNRVKQMVPTVQSNSNGKGNDITLTLVDCTLSKANKESSDSFVAKSDLPKQSPEVVDLISDSDCSPDYNDLIYQSNKQIADVLPTSSRSSCLKTIRRTHDQVEVVSLDHHPL